MDEDDIILAELNVQSEDLDEGWGPISEWTHAGLSVPMRLALRAYHARSFGLGEKPRDDSIVCHIAWYVTDEAAQASFEVEVRETRISEAIYDGIGEHFTITTREIEPSRERPASTSYVVRFARGPFLVMFNSRSFDGWRPDRLADVLRAIDDRLAQYIDQNPRSTVPIRTLKEKLTDPSRAPKCTRLCRVHHRQLEPVMVRISFGLPSPELIPGDPETEWYKIEEDRRRRFEEAKREFFPNTTPKSVSGSCFRDELYDFTHACACPACDEEAEKWPDGYR